MTNEAEMSGGYAEISIHMPHTWHDATLRKPLQVAAYFNPHATYVA